MLRNWALATVLLFACVSKAQTTTKLSGDWDPPEGESKTRLGTILHDKKFDEDERITDLELRAYAGSLNRYSLQFNLGYTGPAVNDLGNSTKPNPDNRPGDNRTKLAGNMGLRYRINKDQGINVGTGLNWYTPYQTVTGNPAPVPKGRKEYDISDPTVSYDITGAAGTTQLRSQFRATYITTDAYRQTAEFGVLGYSQYVKWTPGHGRVILGAQLAFDYFAFERDYEPGDGKVSNYYLNVIPSFEYKLLDSFNFNTSLGYPFSNYRMSDNAFRIDHQLSTWRVGVGWAITHDIYVNPYVNFFAEAPAFNTASASLLTTFSIF